MIEKSFEGEEKDANGVERDTRKREQN